MWRGLAPTFAVCLPAAWLTLEPKTLRNAVPPEGLFVVYAV
jgi:hypothetical protein